MLRNNVLLALIESLFTHCVDNCCAVAARWCRFCIYSSFLRKVAYERWSAT